MRAAAALAGLATLAACEVAPPLSPIDRVTVETLRAEGDDPTVVRPVEHTLLPARGADRQGLEAALAEAGFEDFDVRTIRSRETTVTFRSDARDPTLARQIAWLAENAPGYGFSPSGWTTQARTG